MKVITYQSKYSKYTFAICTLDYSITGGVPGICCNCTSNIVDGDQFVICLDDGNVYCLGCFGKTDLMPCALALDCPNLAPPKSADDLEYFPTLQDALHWIHSNVWTNQSGRYPCCQDAIGYLFMNHTIESVRNAFGNLYPDLQISRSTNGKLLVQEC